MSWTVLPWAIEIHRRNWRAVRCPAASVLQNSLEIGRSAVHTFAYPCDCEGEPRGRKRFHHVIHCAPIECGERILIVIGDENHMTFAARDARDVQPRYAGHLDVEKDHIG